MNDKINVSAVSYINALPLLHGILQHKVAQDINLTLAYPSQIAQRLQDNTIDLGLVSTAALLTIPNAQIVSNYGIAASGAVASVCLFSHVPIEEIATIYLDYQSRTSVRLAEILVEKHWKKTVSYLQAPENFIKLTKGTTAAVIIGDRALQARHTFPYCYDLAEHWKYHTGLDFVFAAWVANKDLPEEFIRKFDEANALGAGLLREAAAQVDFPEYDIETYYTQNIRYELDDSKRAGLQLFLQYLNEPVPVRNLH